MTRRLRRCPARSCPTRSRGGGGGRPRSARGRAWRRTARRSTCCCSRPLPAVALRPEAVLRRVLGVVRVRARPAVAVAEVDDDRRAVDRRLDLRPGRVRAVDLDHVRRVLDRLGVRPVGVRAVAGRRAVGRPDDDHDLRARRRAAAADGTTTPRVATSTKTRAAADLRKGTPRLDGGCEQLSLRLAPVRRTLNRGMVPRPLAPSGRCVRTGDRADWWRSGSERVVAQARHEVGQRRVRSGRGRRGSGGRPASPRATGQGTADRRVVPGEAELVGAVVLVGDEVEQLERLEGEEAVGDAGRDRRPSRRPPARGSRRPAGPVPVEHRPDVDERDERPARPRRPSSRAGGGGVEAAQDARRPRSTGWPGRRSAAPPANSAPPATARGTSRGRRRDGRSRRSGRPAGSTAAGPAAVASSGVMPGPASCAGGPARSRPWRPATTAAARRRAAASARGRPSAAASTGAPRSTPGRRRCRPRGRARPSDVRAPSRPRVAKHAVDEWWMPAVASSASSSTIASATSAV